MPLASPNLCEGRQALHSTAGASIIISDCNPIHQQMQPYTTVLNQHNLLNSTPPAAIVLHVRHMLRIKAVPKPKQATDNPKHSHVLNFL